MLFSSYISLLFLFVILEMSTIFGERLPLSGKGLHTQPHIGNDRNRYLWLKNLLKILSPPWYCQFYHTYLPNFVKNLILKLRPRLYTADHHSKTKLFVSYNLAEYLRDIFLLRFGWISTCPSANTYSLSNFSKILGKKFCLNIFQQNSAKLHISFCETSKDTRNCLEKAMKISHFNPNQSAPSIYIVIELCYFSPDQWEIRIHLLWGKSFNITLHCDPHLNQTKWLIFNELFPLTIPGVLAGILSVCE